MTKPRRSGAEGEGLDSGGVRCFFGWRGFKGRNHAADAVRVAQLVNAIVPRLAVLRAHAVSADDLTGLRIKHSDLRPYLQPVLRGKVSPPPCRRAGLGAGLAALLAEDFGGAATAESTGFDLLFVHGGFLCAPVKPAGCMRMKVPLGEGRAAHAGLEHARLSASSAVKRCERKVQAWY